VSLAADPILRDRGLVLRWFPVTDTSRVVVWFTREHGRLSTLVKGSQRPKSWTLGQYDLFYTCEVLFYGRAREDLHILRECAPLSPRAAFRRDWRACAAASFVSDLLYRVSPPMAAAPGVYDLAERTLDLLADEGPVPALLFWFELHLLRDLGLAPVLSGESDGPTVFDVEAGRVRKPGPSDSPQVYPLSGGCRALLQRLSTLPDPAGTLRLRILPGQVRELAAHLDRFTAWHLDLSPSSRGLALDLMGR